MQEFWNFTSGTYKYGYNRHLFYVAPYFLDLICKRNFPRTMPLCGGGREAGTHEVDALEATLLRAAEVLQEAVRRRREERATQRTRRASNNLEEVERARFQQVVVAIDRKLAAMVHDSLDLEKRLGKLEKKVAIVVQHQLAFSRRKITYAQESDFRMLKRRVRALEVRVQKVQDNHFSSGPAFTNSTSLAFPTSTRMIASPPEKTNRWHGESSYTNQCRPINEDAQEERRMKLLVQEVLARRDLARVSPSPLGEDLCSAAHTGRLNDIWQLIDVGAHVNYIDRDGFTPLLRALCSVAPNTLVVSLLIKKGADVKVVDSHGASAMHFAASYDCTGRCVKLLISAGGDVNARDEEGATPLHLAAGYDNEQVVRLLLEAGARKDLRFWSGVRKNELPYNVAVSDAVCELLSL